MKLSCFNLWGIKKLTTFSLKNYQMLLIIFLTNLILFRIFYGNAFIFSDFARELYIPMSMNFGDVLYKDIFNVYAPLGYQLNAFLISVFGGNLRTFYFAGFINSTLILFGLFFILKLFVKRGSLLIFCILFLIINANIYAVSQTNYITPYSYSLVYALNSFIWALACLLYYLNEENQPKLCRKSQLLLYSSFFFFGMSISFKYEFILFAFVLSAVLLLKKTNIKTLILCLAAFAVVPALSLIDLLLKGVSFNVLKETITYMLLLSKAKSVNILYRYLGFIPSFASIKILFENFFKVLLFCLPVSLLPFFIVNRQFYKKFSLKLRFTFLLILIIAYCAAILFLIKVFTISNSFYFNWIGVFAVVLFMVSCTKLAKKLKNHTIDKQDILFFVLFASTISGSFKCIFNISFNSYGTYYFPLLFICCILYFYLYKIKEIKKSNNKFYYLTSHDIETFNGGNSINNCKKSLPRYMGNASAAIITRYVALFFLITVIFTIGAIYNISGFNRIKYVFGFCKVNIEQELAPGVEQIEALYDIVNYIKNNTNKDDIVLVLPEGASINFLTGRKSHNKYYYLIPPNIEIFGEENIVNDLEKQLPDYLVIQPMSYYNFKETFFCESFGVKICNLIPKYYERPIVFGKEFRLAVYKKKS